MSDEAPPAGPRRRWLRYGLALAIVLGVALTAWWFWSNRQSLAAEQTAAKALEELGVLVVMDGDRRHVASVNLSTVQSSEGLAEALQHLPALNRLNSLDASRTKIRDEQIERLASLSKLNSLSLTETGITDDGARQLAALGNLEALHLASTQITDGSLAALAALDKLRILDVSATKVASNLAPLTRLPQLEWLVLRNLTLEEDALKSLAACRSLRRLSLENSKYSADSAESLKQALSELRVDP